MKTSRKKKKDSGIDKLRQCNSNVITNYAFKKFHFIFNNPVRLIDCKKEEAGIYIEVSDKIREMFVQSLNKNRRLICENCLI